MQERPGRSVRAGFDRHFDQRRPGLRERLFQREFQLGGRFREISGRTTATNASALKQLPAMRAQKDGLIINISSRAGRYPSTLTGAAYNATKRAVIALSESINAEECKNGIRATSVMPGEVATPVLEKRPVPPPKAERERMLQAEDLGQTILYLASLPPRAYVEEIVISPSWNHFYLGGLEKAKA